MSARGGSARAAREAGSAKRTTAAIGGFLASAVTSGLQGALEGLGLARVIGRSAGEVVAEIANALAPAGATKDEVAVRQALNEVLEELFSDLLVEGKGIDSLESLSSNDVERALKTSIEAYVFNRWLGDLGLQIERGAVTAAAAVRLEREMRSFVHEMVDLDLTGKDLLSIDWHGAEGSRLVDRMYRDAYSLIA